MLIRIFLASSFFDLILQAEGTSAESIAALAKVDVVKQRMEAAYATLQVDIINGVILLYTELCWYINVAKKESLFCMICSPCVCSTTGCCWIN